MKFLELRDIQPPVIQELAESRVERRWIDAGPEGLGGKQIEFAGLQFTITDVLARVEFLDGRQWTIIVRPFDPRITIAETQTRWEVVGTYLVEGIRHILLGADHLLFVLGLLHGFGFASALVSFNVGVEIGQLAFVFLVLALEASFRVLQMHWPRWVQQLPV
jgi:hypothetical protein